MGRNLDYPMPLEGRMARQQLARIAMDATKLHNALRDDDDLPAWVLLKINTAEDRLHVAADYLRYKVAPGLDAYNGFGSASRGYAGNSDDYVEEQRRKDAWRKDRAITYMRAGLIGAAVTWFLADQLLKDSAEKKAGRRKK